jgi:lysyl-tRNA synthetase class 2
MKLDGFQPLTDEYYDFIESLKYGMPPAYGIGMGIDRLVIILANAKNIKDVILFPLLKEQKNKKTEN